MKRAKASGGLALALVILASAGGCIDGVRTGFQDGWNGFISSFIVSVGTTFVTNPIIEEGEGETSE